MIRINLVPRDILKKADDELRNRMLVVVVVCVFGVFGGISYSHYRTAVKLKEHLAVQEKELARLQKIVDEVNKFKTRAAGVRARLNVMGELLKNRELYPNFMSRLPATFPAGAWINSLNVTGGPGGFAVSMAANALSVEDLTEWLWTYENSKVFTDHKIGSITISPDTGLLSFSLSVQYTPPTDKK